MDIQGTRTSTIIRMLEIHIHIIPLPQPIGTADTGLTTAIIVIIISTANKPDCALPICELIGSNST